MISQDQQQSNAVGGLPLLASAMALGARRENTMKTELPAIPGHNLPLASVGAFILWFGWFGFNPGSTLEQWSKWELIGTVATNTFLASAAGGISHYDVYLYTIQTNRYHHGDQWCTRRTRGDHRRM